MPQAVRSIECDAREQQDREAQSTIEGNKQKHSYKEWADILNSAAEKSLTKVPPSIRQPYISEDTWKKIEERDKLAAEQDPKHAQKIKEIKKDIKKRIKKYKNRRS